MFIFKKKGGFVPDASVSRRFLAAAAFCLLSCLPGLADDAQPAAKARLRAPAPDPIIAPGFSSQQTPVSAGKQTKRAVRVSNTVVGLSTQPASAVEEAAPAVKPVTAPIPAKPSFDSGQEQAAAVIAREPEQITRAKEKISLKDYEGAFALCADFISRNPDNAAAYSIRAAANYFLFRYDDAVADANRSLRLDKQNPSAYNIRAWALMRKGNYQDAHADVTKALELQPDYVHALHLRSMIAQKLGNYRQMIDDLSRAAKLDKSYDAKLREARLRYAWQLDNSTYTVPGASVGINAVPARSQEPEAERESGKAVYLVIALLALGAGAGLAFWYLKHLRAKPQDEVNLLMNQYELRRQVGAGGMGVVFEGYDKTLKRKVAIKKMKAGTDMTETAKEQFLDEARTVAALHHPNIVDIYTVFEEKGDLFLVFEYVEGQTLETTLKIEGKLGFERAKPIFEATCKALEYAHSHEIIHRDLKPSNIMISDNSTVKVMDFGVACKLAGDVITSASGTPAYMAPEQQDGRPTMQSDIYSLGICLYEVLTGKVPWEISGYSASSDGMIAPSKLVPEIPRELDEIIRLATYSDLERRIKTAAQFWQALSSIKT